MKTHADARDESRRIRDFREREDAPAKKAGADAPASRDVVRAAPRHVPAGPGHARAARRPAAACGTTATASSTTTGCAAATPARSRPSSTGRSTAPPSCRPWATGRSPSRCSAWCARRSSSTATPGRWLAAAGPTSGRECRRGHAPASSARWCASTAPRAGTTAAAPRSSPRSAAGGGPRAASSTDWGRYRVARRPAGAEPGRQRAGPVLPRRGHAAQPGGADHLAAALGAAVRRVAGAARRLGPDVAGWTLTGTDLEPATTAGPEPPCTRAPSPAAARSPPPWRKSLTAAIDGLAAGRAEARRDRAVVLPALRRRRGGAGPAGRPAAPARRRVGLPGRGPRAAARDRLRRGLIVRTRDADGNAQPPATGLPMPLFGGTLDVQQLRLVDAFGRTLELPVDALPTTTTPRGAGDAVDGPAAAAGPERGALAVPARRPRLRARPATRRRRRRRSSTSCTPRSAVSPVSRLPAARPHRRGAGGVRPRRQSARPGHARLGRPTP